MKVGVVSISVHVLREQGRLLSRLAHDLELRLEHLEVLVSDAHIDLTFHPAKLKVVGAMHEGHVDPDLLDAAKKAEVEKNLQQEVFDTDKFPLARFQGTFQNRRDPVVVDGMLLMRGVTNPVEFALHREEACWRGQVTLKPSRWGIAPYRALFGALKLQDRVDVLIVVQDP